MLAEGRYQPQPNMFMTTK